MNRSITKTSQLLLFIAVVLFSFSSCKKDETESPSNNEGVMSSVQYQSGNLIEADFRGQVTDEMGQPVADALISIGSSSTMTNSDGVFQVIGATVDEVRAYIKVEKDGFFHGSRVIVPTDNGFNRVFVQLMTAETTGSLMATTGGEVMHSSGASVILAPNGVVDANGSAYSGIVDVQICYLDPSSTDVLTQMPGNLTALESDNDFVALLTYGMIGVELLSSDGNELQIADGSSATITIPVPASGLNTAPSTIPLWYFDEIAGVWQEEGEAQLVGNEYVGTVEHFSFWNCDVSAEPIFLEGYVLSEESSYGIQGIQIELITGDFGTGIAFSDQNGYYGGIVPSGVELTMNVYSACGDLIFTDVIGPFTTDVQVPDITYFIAENETGFITGQLIDCGGIPVEGYITVTNVNNILPESVEVSSDGSFIMVVPCGSQALELTGYSPNYITTSNPFSVTTIPDYTVDVGNVDLCESLADEYITMNVSGQTINIVDTLLAYDNNGNLTIQGDQFLGGTLGYAFFLFPTSNAPQASDFYLEENYFFIAEDELVGNLAAPSDMNWVFTSYAENAGEYYEFSFEATYDMTLFGASTGTQVISGTGRVQRDF